MGLPGKDQMVDAQRVVFRYAVGHLLVAAYERRARPRPRQPVSGPDIRVHLEVVQLAAVFARKGHALRGALIDDVQADLCQPVHVRLARPEVAALTVS